MTCTNSNTKTSQNENENHSHLSPLDNQPKYQIYSLPISESPRSKGSEMLVRIKSLDTGQFLKERFRLSEAQKFVERSRHIDYISDSIDRVAGGGR